MQIEAMKFSLLLRFQRVVRAEYVSDEGSE